MMVPPLTCSPPKRFTPRRWALLSRPLRELPPPFLCAIAYPLSALAGFSAVVGLTSTSAGFASALAGLSATALGAAAFAGLAASVSVSAALVSRAAVALAVLA